MFDNTKIRIVNDGPLRLKEGLEERLAVIADLEKRIAEASTHDERARLQARLAEVRAEYAPSDQAQERSWF